MGSSIARTAGVARIKESGEKTMTAATARGGEVLELAQKRVAPVLVMLAGCEQQWSHAAAEDDIKHAALLARDNESEQPLRRRLVRQPITNHARKPRHAL